MLRNGKKRVVVTGMGAYTCLGDNPDKMWENLIQGISGVRRITIFDATDFPITIAGEIQNFDAKSVNGEYWAALCGERYNQIGLAAAVQAVINAGFDIDSNDLADAGVVVSNAHGIWDPFPSSARKMIANNEYTDGNGPLIWKYVQEHFTSNYGPLGFNPELFLTMNYDSPSTLIADRLSATGPRFTVSSACVSGAKSVERAVRMLRHGMTDIVITGGAESDVTEYGIWFLDAMRALTSHCEVPENASKPFDKNRSGFVLAEASAILILETLEHASKRGANILAEVVGVGGSANAYSLFAPEPVGEGPAGAMNAALKDAGMNYDEIDAVFAHATATEVGDPAEAGGIKMTFKDHTENVTVTATKCMMGHSIGAAGAVGAIQCVKAVQTNCIPPVINLEDPDESCEGLNIPKNQAEHREIKCVLNNAFGFGGANASNIFIKFTG